MVLKKSKGKMKMNKMHLVRLTSGFVMVLMACTANANLLRNASFEDVPSGATGQGIMPSEWVTSNSSPDTYSNDGSYGLPPRPSDTYPNFEGVTAYDGIRWVAGWSYAEERFGQTLTDNLISGTDYIFSGYLHQAFRSDLNHPGGYELFLTGTSTSTPLSGEYLGYLGATTSYSDGWQQYSFSFTATDAMANLDFLMFSPTKAGTGESYPGLDLVSLDAVAPPPNTSVPESSSIYLLAFGLLGLFAAARRKV